MGSICRPVCEKERERGGAHTGCAVLLGGGQGALLLAPSEGSGAEARGGGALLLAGTEGSIIPDRK